MVIELGLVYYNYYYLLLKNKLKYQPNLPKKNYLFLFSIIYKSISATHTHNHSQSVTYIENFFDRFIIIHNKKNYCHFFLIIILFNIFFLKTDKVS